MGQDTGLLLTQVAAGSQADRSRLVQRDTLVTLNGQPLRSLADLVRVLSGDWGKGRIAARLVRDGQVQAVDVAIGERAGGGT